MVPSTEVLSLKVVKASETIASRLELKKNDAVIYLHRKDFADNEPIVQLKLSSLRGLHFFHL